MPKIVNNPALGWVSARHLQHVVARAEAAGIPVDELLSEGGLDKASLDQADRLVPVQALESMLAAVVNRYPDPLMGLHLAGDIQPATYGAIGYLAQACITLSDALEMVARYNGLLSNIGKTSLIHGPGTVKVCWECLAGSAPLRRQLSEYVLGSFVGIMRLLLPEQKELLRSVQFAHAPPAKPELVRQYFRYFNCPVYFDRPVCSFSISADVVNTRLHHGDVRLKEVLERHAQSLMQQRQQTSSLRDEVRHLIAAMIADGLPGRDVVAAQLGLSGRSLHRKLEEEGSSYREILDELRLEIAQSRLSQGGDSLSRIAEQLGFRSRQAFLRWYKLNTGKTPGDYRKAMTGGPA